MGKRPDLAQRNRDNAIHGLSHTTTYTVWRQMKNRCLKETNKDFSRYGGRGIKLDPRWLNFKNFVSDMGKRPEKMQLDRIDTNGDYTKNNCRWVSASENCNNKRNNHIVSHNGMSKTLIQWARYLNICPKTLRHRIVVAKWSLDKALSPIVKKHNRGKKNDIK